MSNEHLVTEGLFPDGTIVAQGLPWCPEPKTVGLANLTAKLLCSTHNSSLSVVDSAAIEAKKAFDAALDLMNFRAKYKKQRWTRQTFTVNGYLLERWFLKTLINVVQCGVFKLPVGSDATEHGLPSRRLVEIAFGSQRFDKPEGMYSVAILNEPNSVDDRFQIVTLTKNNHIGGALFRFGSLNYHLHLESESTTTAKSFAPHLQEQLLSAQFIHHLRQSNFKVHDIPSHSVIVRW
jgi:hypothetical protein